MTTFPPTFVALIVEIFLPLMTTSQRKKGEKEKGTGNYKKRQRKKKKKKKKELGLLLVEGLIHYLPTSNFSSFSFTNSLPSTLWEHMSH
jgi:hypothetical protein